MQRHQVLALPRDELLRADPKDLKLFLGGTKFSNELNIASKFLWFSRNGLYSTSHLDIPEHSGQLSLFNYSISMLAGHVYECYKFLDSSNVRRIAKDERLTSTSEFCETLPSILSYFKGHNLIKAIRDRISFHSDLSFLSRQVEVASKDYMFLYVEGDMLGHSVYRGVDDLIAQAFSAFEKSEALPKDELYPNAADQIIQVADMMGNVLSLMLVYLGVCKIGVHLGRMVPLPESGDGPPIDMHRLPFFCQPPADEELRAKLMRSLDAWREAASRTNKPGAT